MICNAPSSLPSAFLGLGLPMASVLPGSVALLLRHSVAED